MEGIKIAVIGLGYVGLPLAVEFAKLYNVVGFDINKNRINELNQGYDKTLEISKVELEGVSKIKHHIKFTSDSELIKSCNYYIVTVPTPVDKNNNPDLSPLYKASELVGKNIKKGDIVIYESTVYPGVTEDECVPVLELHSNMKFNVDFFCGYSPERINPGDKLHTIATIRKITSGSNPEIAEKVDKLYSTIIKAGTHKAKSIKVAEAAKVIENAQRDINIAFVNELAKIFNILNIDTNEVLDAAGSKWNFLPFKPGLVGGHCIGVDPYYLANKAQEKGYHPEIILAGRRLNDGMGGYIAKEVIRLMIRKDINVKKSNILILGFTFKENCPDVRNTKVIDIINEFRSFEINLDVHDPWADEKEVKKIYNFNLIKDTSYLKKKYDAVILAVSHTEFLKIDWFAFTSRNTIIYDVKGILSTELITARL